MTWMGTVALAMEMMMAMLLALAAGAAVERVVVVEPPTGEGGMRRREIPNKLMN